MMIDQSQDKRLEPLDLPRHLAERTRICRTSNRVNAADQDLRLADGRFVLYWMRTAMRIQENPALDVAIHLADRHDLPLLIYQGLSCRYDYASDRHHTFILQGAKELQESFRNEGLNYRFYLETGSEEKPPTPLRDFRDDAAVVITEEMPVDPPRKFLRSLVRNTSTPVLAVDTACVFPMRFTTRATTRAFKFRTATEKMYAQRVGAEYPQLQITARPFNDDEHDELFTDLTKHPIAELVAKCDIDHLIGPAVDTPGGSSAGLQRWAAFQKQGLSKYDRKRNNVLAAGVSRLSAYLHYGMISPFQIAREAQQPTTSGSEKYLDELLIWRELAYHFCFHRPDHDRVSALPDWARETLAAHSSDPRPAIYSWEELARGQTDDELWNAAQSCLLRQGELHNNLRMTWGKAILNWTPDANCALKTIIDLNHRYALDGRDPASYGGILWCLGQFDRPFEPESPILGKVRSRPTKGHARRLDVSKFRQTTLKARFDATRVAVIGAGISGLIAARTLSDHGIDVNVFEKSRGVGGRMSTRRVDGVPRFDHGAQYFTARHELFQRYVGSWQQQGLVQRWPSDDEHQQIAVIKKQGQEVTYSDSTDRWVAVPGMNAICKHLAEGLTLHKTTQIDAVLQEDQKLSLKTSDGQTFEGFDRVLVSTPAEQAAELLAGFPNFAEQMRSVQMDPCWALMASFDHPLECSWVGAFLHDSFLSWASRNSSKPERPDEVEDFVIHASPEWTAEHWDDDPDRVATEMIDEFWRATGLNPQQANHLVSHRWKYAIPSQILKDRCLADTETGLYACGDWCGGPRVEGAFLSGAAAAGRILGTLEHESHRAVQELLF